MFVLVNEEAKAAALLGILLAGAGLGGPGPADAEAETRPAWVDGRRIRQADAEPESWLTHGRTYDEQRHSPLASIHAGNVGELGLSWSFDTNTNRGLEATPIVVDGVLYATGGWSVVYALDARTGTLLWEHDPKVPRSIARAACCDVVNRGVAVWKGRVYVGTLDGRLQALDAATGALVWEALTVDPAQPYTITGAPRVVEGKVIIGNGGAEYGVRGYVSAYDAATGALVWRFHTVPGNPADGFENEAMARAAETWTGEWWKLGGGGTVWDSLAYDPVLRLLYVGVGNGTPWNRRLRSPGGGDNLFLTSIVALDPDTGAYRWHYQVVPAETWDYTATQHMILADLPWHGRMRKLLLQAPKSGFFIVLDRETGELLSAEPYVEVNWATHYDLATGRPVEVPGMDYAGTTAVVKPGGGGGHNWQPMAFNPETGLVYIPAQHVSFVYRDLPVIRYEPGLRHTGTDRSEVPPGDELFFRAVAQRLARGSLLAWDPVAGRARWSVPHVSSWNGGVLSTAGNLVFQGTGDQRFAAYRADTGERLWETPTRAGIIAAPISYAVDGEQFITVLAGWGGAFGLMSGLKPAHVPERSRILSYRLGGEAVLPPPTAPAPIADPPPRRDVDEAVLERGGALYESYCAFCHGTGMISNGALPDLRRLRPEVHASFDAIVRHGVFSGLGMPGFADVLDEDDVAAIQAFAIEKAHEDRALRESPAWWRRLLAWVYAVVSWFVVRFLDLGIATA